MNEKWRVAVLRKEFFWKALIINIKCMKFFYSNEVDNKKLFLRGVLNSLGTVIYIIAVTTFLNNAQRIFGKEDNSFFIPIIMMLLFVLSALITGSFVLGKPIMLYLDGQKKEGVTLLLYTAFGLAVILALVILAYMGLR